MSHLEDDKDTSPENLRGRIKKLELEQQELKEQQHQLQVENNLELTRIREELERLRRLLEAADEDRKVP